MRVLPALHVRYAGPRHRVRAADLDSVHQIEALERDLLDRAEVDRRSVVDADVDAAELLDGLGHRRGHRVTVPAVADHRKRLAPGLLDLLGRGVDGARKLGMGSAVLATSAMFAPSAATRLAIDSPIPRLAPEINRGFPLSVIAQSYLNCSARPLSVCSIPVRRCPARSWTPTMRWIARTGAAWGCILVIVNVTSVPSSTAARAWGHAVFQ